ncbi:MAG: hypothetical protein M1834_003444 [Cirrosporium novae-zelandiae]|nr:MAG: hypothetical protein M1834_003444 [Cirrosporium novae-zelandiae]
MQPPRPAPIEPPIEPPNQPPNELLLPSIAVQAVTTQTPAIIVQAAPQYYYARPITPPEQLCLDRDKRLRAQTLFAHGLLYDRTAIELSHQLHRPITKRQIQYTCTYRITPQHRKAGRSSSLTVEKVDKLACQASRLCAYEALAWRLSNLIKKNATPRIVRAAVKAALDTGSVVD